MYRGVVKISDFGKSKRLAGINPCADSFKGKLIKYVSGRVRVREKVYHWQLGI